MPCGGWWAPYMCCEFATWPLLNPGNRPACMPPIIDMGVFGLCTFVMIGPFMAGREYDGHGWREKPMCGCPVDGLCEGMRPWA